MHYAWVIKTDKSSSYLISDQEEVMYKKEEKIVHLVSPIQSLAILLYLVLFLPLNPLNCLP